ncbi:hydroxyisourate hydrolase [Vibrio pectenicida]|uniref:5-hydroxyisourate hydrolase n=1 Tax=Vibrio pectenicida TaxID=62763 RepID=A0A3R9FL55_9VIBR|nr:hydroxyisourate hydrolase [Vibrio pectenicida]RSD30583.1 hydroxyisourate hydrolase [Vibrio pectenicida]
MTKLTTHVLDTMKGLPAAGVKVEIYRLEDETWEKLNTMETNQDGRTQLPLLQGHDYKIGKYQLIFYVGGYFAQSEDPSFLDDIVIRFGLSEPQSHMHVPLLVSPFSFSSYRGS